MFKKCRGEIFFAPTVFYRKIFRPYEMVSYRKIFRANRTYYSKSRYRMIVCSRSGPTETILIGTSR